MDEKHHPLTLESQRTRRSNLTRTSQTKPALRHHQTGRRLRRPTAAQARPNLVPARAGTPTPPRHYQPSKATTSSTSANPTTATRTPPELHDILHKKSASWTPSPSLNTPTTTTTTTTTTSTTHTPKKSHHGRHKNAVRRRPTTTTSPRQRRPTRRGHRLLMHRLPSTHLVVRNF